MTNSIGMAMVYPVIALRKLEKPVVRRAPEGAFRYLWKYKGGGEMKKKRFLTKEVYETIVTRDLLQKYALPDTLVLQRLSEFLMDNISNLTSPNKKSVSCSQRMRLQQIM